MPRPRRCRRVWFEPNVTYFKPARVPLRDLEEVILTVVNELSDKYGKTTEEYANNLIKDNILIANKCELECVLHDISRFILNDERNWSDFMTQERDKALNN